jgi:hypothetical protein
VIDSVSRRQKRMPSRFRITSRAAQPINCGAVC